MNIVIINGNPDAENTMFDRYLQGYQTKLRKTGHYVKSFRLREMRIAFMDADEGNGPRDPKIIPMDDVRYILNILGETDLMVWASPLKGGFVSLLTKGVQNRVYRYIKDKFSEHDSKWKDPVSVNRIPLTGMIVQPESDTDDKEILLNRLTQERMAANLNTVLSFFITSEISLTDAACVTFQSFDYRLYIEETCNDFLSSKASLA